MICTGWGKFFICTSVVNFLRLASGLGLVCEWLPLVVVLMMAIFFVCQISFEVVGLHVPPLWC